MRRTLALAAALSLLSAPAGADPPAPRTWEVNGIRLEPGQVERLAADMADRTVQAVETHVKGIALDDAQRDRMHEIYRTVSLDVYDRVVEMIGQADLDDEIKERRVRELVLEGQSESHKRLEGVLDARQLGLYSAWEERQVEAFKSRRWERRRGSRRRTRPDPAPQESSAAGDVARPSPGEAEPGR